MAYHHLFADLLRARLQQDCPDGRRNCISCCRWYNITGWPMTRSTTRLAAGDPARAARLIEKHFDTVFSVRGEEATIRAGCRPCPRSCAISSPSVAGAGADGGDAR